MLYVSPARIVAAGRAADRAERVALMARTMQEAAAAHGSCDLKHLSAAGFTTAESLALADDARALLSGRPLVAQAQADAAKAETGRLLDQARRVRRRLRDRARRAARRARGAAA